jgi:hypothetical protein
MVRRQAGDSSVSLRMAERSSVAEITGKSMTNTHPKASRHWRALNWRLKATVLEPRHSQTAGSANSSHARFSSSSMKLRCPNFPVTSFSETSNSSQCDFGQQGLL